ncbi:MAG: hypothetical protein V4563_14800 [Pseudomonadota bacterium]
MQLPTVADALASRLPGCIGKCSSDVAGVCAYINSATMRLLYAREVGDTSWWGSWREVLIEISREEPHITLPFEVARIINLDICTFPVAVQNEFFSYLRYGAGRWPKNTCVSNRTACAPLTAFDRGTFPTFKDIITEDKKLRFYLTDVGDVGKRVLAQYKDSNDVPVRTLDGTVAVLGEFLTLVSPFVDSTFEVWPERGITGIQKDVTLGRVLVYSVDTVTAEEVLISYLEPNETSANLRRYYVSGLPRNCCNLPESTSTTVQVTALCKLEYVPVSVVTDALLIPNIEALTHECQAVRFSEMDVPSASQKEQEHHINAIRLLQGQMVANEGTQQPAIIFAPFNNSRLVRQGVGITF